MKRQPILAMAGLLGLGMVLFWGCNQAHIPAAPARPTDMSIHVPIPSNQRAQLLGASSNEILYNLSEPGGSPVTGVVGPFSTGSITGSMDFSIPMAILKPGSVLALQLNDAASHSPLAVGAVAVGFSGESGAVTVDMGSVVRSCYVANNIPAAGAAYYFDTNTLNGPVTDMTIATAGNGFVFLTMGNSVAYMGNGNLVNFAYLPDSSLFTYSSSASKLAQGATSGNLAVGDVYCVGLSTGHAWVQITNAGSQGVTGPSFRFRINHTLPYYAYDATTCDAAGRVPTPVPASGCYNLGYSVATTDNFSANNTVYYNRYNVPVSEVFGGFQVKVLNPANVELALYNDSGSGSPVAGPITNLAGSVTLDTGVVQAMTGWNNYTNGAGSITLAPGNYWIGYATDTALNSPNDTANSRLLAVQSGVTIAGMSIGTNVLTGPGVPSVMLTPTNGNEFDTAIMVCAPGGPSTPKIYFTSYPPGNSYYQVYGMNTDGTNRVPLTSGTSYSGAPDYNSVVNQVAYHNYAATNYQIYKMNADGTGKANLSNSSTGDYNPSWSPNGTQIVFTRSSTSLTLATMNADGSAQVTIGPVLTLTSHPSWQPVSGAKIAYDDLVSGYGQIFTMNTDGSGVTQITPNGSDNEFPSWSPDGSKIAFYSTRTGIGNIFVMNADGSNVVQVTTDSTGGDYNYSPQWSADGTTIYFAATHGCSNQQIYSVPAGGGTPVDISHTNISDWFNDTLGGC